MEMTTPNFSGFMNESFICVHEWVKLKKYFFPETERESVLARVFQIHRNSDREQTAQDYNLCE